MKMRFGGCKLNPWVLGGLLFVASFHVAHAADPAPPSQAPLVSKATAKKATSSQTTRLLSSRRQLAREYAQADNFGQACALLLQSCYYCCLGCGDLGLNLANAPVQPPETPVPAPIARAQAF